MKIVDILVYYASFLAQHNLSFSANKVKKEPTRAKYDNQHIQKWRICGNFCSKKIAKIAISAFLGTKLV